MQERHTGEYQYEHAVKLLNILAPKRRDQLIGRATDSAAAMTVHICGTCTRLGQECTLNIFWILIWSAPFGPCYYKSIQQVML